jgi:hypothetical protein
MKAAPAIVVGMLVYLGVVARILTPNPAIIVVAGLLLWLLSFGVMAAVCQNELLGPDQSMCLCCLF